jgi:hypothetical protein
MICHVAAIPERIHAVVPQIPDESAHYELKVALSS